MIPVSGDFDAAVVATVRDPRARVTITWTDSNIDSTIAASANEENRISYPDTVGNMKTDVPYKWAHLDGVIKADGTYYAMPGTAALADIYEVGWWGATACDGAGDFALPYPTLTVTFAARPVTRFRVVGDNQYNEYPVDFVITCYNGAVLVHTETVTGNTDLNWESELIDPLLSVTEMRLAVSKWSDGDRIVKVTEFYTDLVQQYDGDDIMSINLQEERQLKDGTLPVGNISANEIDIRLQNVTDEFFPGNTGALLHTLIKPNRRIAVEFGFVLPDETIEYVPMGTFWSGDFDIPEDGTYIGTTARDRMELLRKKKYTNSTLYRDYDLYDLMEIVLQDAKLEMDDLTWTIDASLHDYEVEWAWFPVQTYFQTIKDIVSACCGYAYMSREDVLTIVGPE